MALASSLSATLDDDPRTSAHVIVAPGQTIVAALETEDLDDANAYLQVSNNGQSWATARDSAGSEVSIVGAGSTLTDTLTAKNETTGPLLYRVQLVLRAGEAAVVGEVDVVLSVYDKPVLDLTSLPEYADNEAALTAGEPLGAAYADPTGAIFRVIAA